ncbi:MAG TPA: zinc-dependent alcohol dehydrogenase family protein [Devosia sp.]
MQAARLVAVGEMHVLELERPEPGPNDLLVRVEACGLCGSDRHMFRGEYPTALPVTLGHEFAGIVEQAGEAANGFPLGARITGDPNISCGQCAQCRAGRPNLCARLTPIGVFRDGGFADYVIVPQQQAVQLPETLNPLHGAFCEPVGCCLHALDVASIEPGASVVIFGGGVIGLLMVQLAKLAGAGAVILSTRQQPRRELAERLGATNTVNAAADPVAEIHRLLPNGVDVAIECAGVAETFSQSIAAVRRGGTVVIFGVMPHGELVRVSPYDLLVNELRLESAWLNPGTHRRAAELVASGALDLDALITRTIPLQDLPVVLATPPTLGEVKTIVVP